MGEDINTSSDKVYNTYIIDKLKTSKNSDDLKKIVDSLSNSVKEIFTSNQYKNYLDYISLFYNYSFNNNLLIAKQNPDAKHVGSLKFWNRLNRHIKKGEHGITIIAPIVDKKMVESIEIKDGKEIKIANNIPFIKGFRTTTVFDISQTAGEQVPDLPIKLLITGTNEELEIAEHIKNAIISLSAKPIQFNTTLPKGVRGRCTPDKIFVSKELSALHETKTLIHEYVHSLLDLPTEPNKEPPVTRGYKEMRAEGIAYTISKSFGIDTSEYSFGYIASWADSKNDYECKAVFEDIAKISKKIINDINDQLENQLYQSQKKAIESIIKKAGFKPTEKLTENIYALNRKTCKENTLSDIKDMFSSKENKYLVVKDIVKDIVSECQNQELSKTSHEVVPAPIPD